MAGAGPESMRKKRGLVLEHFEYMGKASTAAFASLADAQLVVEGKRLPVHSTILAANSDVFAQMFVEAKVQHPTHRQLEVPLPGDSLQDVSTALHYLYKGCTVWLASALEISETQDAISLAKFAHKYGIEALLQACQEYLVATIAAMEQKPQLSANAVEFLLQPADFRKRVQVEPRTCNWTMLAQLMDLAETCGMRRLLAHCEVFMIRNGDKDLWQHPAMLSDQVSKHSLLRMLRGLRECSDNRATNRGHHWHGAVTPNGSNKVVEELMSWNKL